MQKKFIINLFILIFLNLLIKPFWVWIDLEVQNEVGTVSYGSYFALFNFSFLLNMLMDLGMTHYNTRNIARDHHLLTEHFSKIIAFKLLLGLGCLIFIAVAGIIIGYRGQEVHLLLFMILNQFLISMILYLRSNITGLQLFKSESLLSILDRAIMIVCCSTVMWGGILEQGISIKLFVYIQTLAYSLTALAAFLIVVSRTTTFRINWDRTFIYALIGQTWPYALLVLLMMIYSRVDAVLLERMAGQGAREAGIYAAGFRLLDALNNLALLFGVLLYPIFSKMLREKKDVRELVGMSSAMLLVPATILTVALSLYSFDVMSLLYDREQVDSSRVFKYLIFSMIAMSVTYIYGSLLTANGNLKQLNQMAGSAVVINVGLNLALIPNYGALGSAMAAVITQFYAAFYQFFLSIHLFQLRIPWTYLPRIGIFIAGLAIIPNVLASLELDWIKESLTFILGSIVWAFICGLLNIKMLYRILRYG